MLRYHTVFNKQFEIHRRPEYPSARFNIRSAASVVLPRKQPIRSAGDVA
jgi:hypothetical protein